MGEENICNKNPLMSLLGPSPCRIHDPTPLYVTFFVPCESCTETQDGCLHRKKSMPGKLAEIIKLENLACNEDVIKSYVNDFPCILILQLIDFVSCTEVNS